MTMGIVAGAMPYDDLTFTREKLYEEVWTRPVAHVARGLNVSDVAVAKICRKLAVPVPGRGYCAKLAAGDTPKRAPLPDIDSAAPRTHVFRRWHTPEGPIAPVAAADGELVVHVNATLDTPHPLVRDWLRNLRSKDRVLDTDVPQTAAFLDVNVSDAVVDRAVRIIDALIKGLTLRGHAVEIRKEVPPPLHYSYYAPAPTTPLRWETVAVVQETAVVIALRESTEVIAVPPPPPSALRSSRSWVVPQAVRESIPNGRLVLSIRNGPQRVRTTIGDTKLQVLETRIGAFILAIEAAAAVLRAEHEEAARKEEEAQQRELEQEREEAEKRRIGALVEDLHERLDLWASARSMRELAQAVEAVVDTGDGARTRWVRWVRRRAARLETRATTNLPDPDAKNNM
jgi:hypothetical protein